MSCLIFVNITFLVLFVFKHQCREQITLLICYITTMNRRSWNEADMLNAHEAVNINNVSISAAAKECGVPRMTLSDRVKGNVPMDMKMGRPPVLGDDH